MKVVFQLFIFSFHVRSWKRKGWTTSRTIDSSLTDTKILVQLEWGKNVYHSSGSNFPIGCSSFFFFFFLVCHYNPRIRHPQQEKQNKEYLSKGSKKKRVGKKDRRSSWISLVIYDQFKNPFKQDFQLRFCWKTIYSVEKWRWYENALLICCFSLLKQRAVKGLAKV